MTGLDKKAFEQTVQNMIQNPDPAATKAWLDYSEDLERDDICDAADFRRMMCQELLAIRKDFGLEIAEQLYNAGKEFTFNPFELRRAADLLKRGLTVQEAAAKALDGMCDGDGPVPKRPRKQKDHTSIR